MTSELGVSSWSSSHRFNSARNSNSHYLGIACVGALARSGCGAFLRALVIAKYLHLVRAVQTKERPD